MLGRKDYADVAALNAEFLLKNMLRDGRLLRTYKDGEAKLNGYLEDYAFLIDGLLALHEATFSRPALDFAIELGNAMVELFWDAASSQFFDTGHDHEQLVVRPKDVTDNAIPCGSSMAVDVLLKLAVITGDGDMERRASAALRTMRQLMMTFPTAAGHWLGALELLSVASEGDGHRGRAWRCRHRCAIGRGVQALHSQSSAAGRRRRRSGD